jgi:hypothetical protein
MMSVLLLAVAQQLPVNVKWLDSKIITRADVAQEAQRFVASDVFIEMCRCINVHPELLREMKPTQAMRLFATLNSEKKEHHEFD